MPSQPCASFRAVVRPRSETSTSPIAVTTSRNPQNWWTARPNHLHGASLGGSWMAWPTPAFAGPMSVSDSTRTCTPSSGTGKRFRSRFTSAPGDVPRLPQLSCSVPLVVSNSNSRANHRVRRPLLGPNRPRATDSSDPARCHSNRKQPAATLSVTHIRSDSAARDDWPPATTAGNSHCPSEEDTAISATTGRAACPAQSRPANQAQPACR